MQFKDEAIWQSWVDANQDDYGKAIIRFAERWADMMEEAIGGGECLEDVADRMSDEADDEGITGAMYGIAVSMLSQAWVHGEALRVWSNNRIALSADDAERANTSGSTLNPAFLTVSYK